MLTTILWDHDGVLVDTERLYYQATRERLARVGVNLTIKHYQRDFLVSSRGAWHLATESVVFAPDVERLRRDRDALYWDALSKSDVLIPGALDLLKRLTPRYRMAVVTSSRREHFKLIHRHSGLRDLLEFGLTRKDYSESKPHPEPYLQAVARLDVTKESCLVIEDSPRGLLAATAAGLRCWIVSSEMTSGLCFDTAERQFRNLAELEDALDLI